MTNTEILKKYGNIIEALIVHIKSNGLKIESKEDLDEAFKSYLRLSKELNDNIESLPISSIKLILGL